MPRSCGWCHQSLVVNAQEEEQRLREQVDAATDEGVDVSVPMSVFQDIQERR